MNSRANLKEVCPAVYEMKHVTFPTGSSNYAFNHEVREKRA